MREVPVEPVTLAPYRQVFGAERTSALFAAADRVRERLGGRTVWHINSTDAGGGVAELLSSLVPLARAIGMDTRWLAIDGDAEFFEVAKRLCTRLYGAPGDAGRLGPAELARFREVNADNAAGLGDWIAPGDLVIVHDAQPAGLVDAARSLGATVVWWGHVGRDEPNEHTRDGWAFLRPFVEAADATVFLSAGLVPDWAPHPMVINPSIDPCAAKNLALDADQVTTVLGGIGVLDAADGFPVTTKSPLGGPVRIHRPAAVVRDGPPPAPDVPMVVQVSRWDELKDMAGVLDAFVATRDPTAHLTLAGAEVDGVCDDPQATRMFEQCHRRWAELPADLRRRCQLVCLPMADLRENAIMVNALQRHAAVVVQKSLAEGFGLTATEAMWKSRPVLASAVGGLCDQVVDGDSGLLIDDPHDIDATARALRRLLSDRTFAAKLGGNAHRRVAGNFLSDRHLLDWARLFEHATEVA
ncbi:MAG TPA: glycosyltransferase [Pseudonocardiaceae bacterium]|jgi:trehalose synthase|nr:glycosyltransferase [Pseudonocardiaceae bacterium]